MTILSDHIYYHISICKQTKDYLQINIVLKIFDINKFPIWDLAENYFLL